MQRKIEQLVNDPRFQWTVITLILLNAVVIGFETYPSIYLPRQDLFFWLELFFLWTFTVEIVLRMVAARSPLRFFKSGWNIFDFIIVASGHLLVGGYFVSILRILRILRVLRAVTVIPSLQRVVSALLRTIPAIGNIMILLSLLFYIFAVIGTMLFRDVAPEYFGTLHHSLLTLFQIVTLESWASGVMRPMMEASPYSWIYFVFFILTGTFIVVNLFIGVIVSNVQDVADICPRTKQPRPTPQEHMEHLSREMHELRQQIRQLQSSLQDQQRRE
ncbi:ion transporter [Desulfurispira natronophila]|uniref:Voltage-gated sodium channel n=1 Tax=Desulfurispira natronophila TaxID=682562 RepID=A0A7W8DGL0_9BACT|nr:ion transporter [Desulfurispira natronophila]MBB5021479.1 voltage-gated sodium channel [Desulfurispira natronophila]